MLNIWILNVGHGDSIVLENIIGENKYYGIIDSNLGPGGSPPALNKLNELGATRISFVALTHPHADHFSGLYSIIDTYDPHIDEIYIFPIKEYTREYLKKIATIYKRFAMQTDSPEIIRGYKEFVYILAYLKHTNAEVQPLTGNENYIRPRGFNDIDIAAVQPPSRVKGSFFELIDKEDPSITFSDKNNDLSLAFRLLCREKRILLGGDATYTNWMYHSRIWGKHSINLESDAAKLPHHGSKHDCSRKVLDYLYDGQREEYACISADGRSHPSSETLKLIGERGIQPYCTNLAEKCGSKIERMLSFPGVDAELRRQINILAEGGDKSTKQPCQGDIKITIEDSGELSVTPQYNHPCPYRGGYDFLLK